MEGGGFFGGAYMVIGSTSRRCVGPIPCGMVDLFCRNSEVVSRCQFTCGRLGAPAWRAPGRLVLVAGLAAGLWVAAPVGASGGRGAHWEPIAGAEAGTLVQPAVAPAATSPTATPATGPASPAPTLTAPAGPAKPAGTTPAAPAPASPAPASPAPVNPAATTPAAAALPPTVVRPAPVAAPASQPATAAETTTVVSSLVATIALVDLRLNPAPQRRDFLIALPLLRAASEMQPEDAVLLRYAIDAASAADDRPALDALLRRLVKLDPTDTTAQLTLINRQIQSSQTVAERLELYERFLGPKGQNIDSAIRSRLALDSAMMSRERGDDDAFLRRLLLATQLDSTNAEAAALYADALIPTLNDPGARFELLANTLLADPMDTRTNLRIARYLASSGASKGSLRFFTLAEKFEKIHGRGLDPAEQAEMAIQKWLMTGAAGVYAEMTRSLTAPRKQINDEWARREAAKQDTEGLPKAEEIQLPLEVEFVRIATAIAGGDAAGIAGTLKDLGDSLAMRKKWLDEPLKRPPAFTAERVQNDLEFWQPQLLAFKLWAGVDEPDLAEKVAALPETNVLRPRLMALLKARTDLPGAIADLQSQSDGDAITAMCRAWLLEKVVAADEAKDPAKKKSAVEAYTALIAVHPGTLAAAVATTRLIALEALPVPSAVVAKLETLAAAVPTVLESLADQPNRRASLVMDAPSLQVGPLERIMLRARLKNTTSIALAIGPDRAISNRAILAPTLRFATEIGDDFTSFEPLNFDRRLRLMPGEEVTVTAWADAGFTAWSSGNHSPSAQRFAYRLLLGFVVDNLGSPQLNGAGFSADTSGILRTSPPSISQDRGAVNEALLAASGKELFNLIAGLRPRFVSSGTVPDVAVDKLVETLIGKYAGATAQERAAMLCLMPHERLAPICKKFDDAVLSGNEADALVRMLRIVTRVAAADSPLLAAGTADTELNVRNVAALHGQRLERKDLMLATTTSIRRRNLEVAAQIREPGINVDPSKTDPANPSKVRPERPAARPPVR